MTPYVTMSDLKKQIETAENQCEEAGALIGGICGVIAKNHGRDKAIRMLKMTVDMLELVSAKGLALTEADLQEILRRHKPCQPN